MQVNTKDICIMDLLSDNKTYVVPLFQRGYCWGEEQINDFWEDLLRVCNNEADSHFLGAMVFTPHEMSETKVTILDGQQRFATAILFLASLRDLTREKSLPNCDVRISLINDKISFGDVVTCSRSPKLELNKGDKAFFDKLVIQSSTSETSSVSHVKIKEAYSRFKKFLSDKIDRERDKEAFVQKILNALFNKFLIIKIEVDSDVDAHMIFETLNDRGLELSVSDLVKNYLFTISEPNLSVVSEKWNEVIEEVGDHNLTRFLRHFWVSHYELVRKEELYKKLKNEVKRENALDFIEVLSKDAEIYSNFNNPDLEFWEDSETRDLVEELNNLRVEQIHILLLALYDRYNSDAVFFKKILRTLIDFTFRYNTVCNSNPNELERVYCDLSLKLRKNKVDGKGVLGEIATLSPSKENFLESFNKLTIKTSRLAKYILVKINNSLLKTQGDAELTSNVRSINLEHIAPKKPNEEWKHIFNEKELEYSDFVNRVGNMTVLLEEYNQKLANKSFDKKKIMYQKSKLPLNKGLGLMTSFGPREIGDRQKQIGLIAETIWKC